MIASSVEDSGQGSYLAMDPNLVQKIFDSLSQQIENRRCMVRNRWS